MQIEMQSINQFESQSKRIDTDFTCFASIKLFLNQTKRLYKKRQMQHPQYSNAYTMQGCLFKSRPSYTNMPNRSIITNVPDSKVCDNRICTSKYTVFNFVPLNLFYQFSKVANLYFLIVGLMQMVPSISVSGGFPVIYIPLAMVLGVSAFKDFYQDLKRKGSDAQINSKEVDKLTAEGFQKAKWENLLIGDIVKVHKNELFPADMILLQSSEAQLNCFIETMNLDGETNLKAKQVKYQIGSLLRPSQLPDTVLYKTHQTFKYQRPNPFIHTFTGSWGDVPLDNNNVVLRGCSLRITDWVTGVIVYTGVDSKIMLNSNDSRQKKSRLQFKMGLIVAVVFLAQMLITMLSAVLSLIQGNANDIQIINGWEYVNIFHIILVKWGSWILLFTNFVPISLIVSFEMVKYIQGINISRSTFFVNEGSKAEVTVQTSSLNEELGQIQHLFSDKTGTLTKNHMNFKYMTVGSETYGYDTQRRAGAIPESITNVDFHDEKFMRMMSKFGRNNGEKEEKESIQNSSGNGNQLYDMMVMFALCHSVVLQKDEQGNERFNASSPDELAFINMAKYCGWEYIGKNDTNEYCIRRGAKSNSPSSLIKYRILHSIQFNSDRKRMTVILQRDGRIFVYCKGADNVIAARIKNQGSKTDQVVKERIEEWSIQGLRTLLFARRQIKKADYQKWARMYAYSLSKLQQQEKTDNDKLKNQFISRLSASGRGEGFNEESEKVNSSKLSFENMGNIVLNDVGSFGKPNHNSNKMFEQRPQKLMNKLLNDNSVLSENQKKFIDQYLDNMVDQQSMTATSAELQDMLEKELTLIGSTAVQDKLQDNVKGTIQKLRMAGIKVWMLTGDKKQTAVNIGRACGLIQENMALVYWDETVEKTLENRKRDYELSKDCCLVATGEDLLGQVSEAVLLQLVNLCACVICCRVTPRQKQDMVWLMRKNKCTTLGIGDGANDVNMINTAHVGVGVKGVEGAQAALSSDYAVSEFQLLGELLLYHGRQSYRKNSQLILFTFYKNLLLVLPQFWFGFRNNFSSATIYDPWVYQLYNVAFTSFPIIIFAIYDQHYSPRISLKNPKLYSIGLQNRLFNPSFIVLWFLQPLVFSFFLTLINYNVLEGSINSKGYMFDMMSTGMCIFAQCVIVANLKVIVLSYSESIGLYLACGFGVGMFYLSSWLFEKWFMDLFNVLENSTTTLGYWACIVANICLIMSYEKIKKSLRDTKQMQEVRNQSQRNVQLKELESGQSSYGLNERLLN